MTKVFKDQEFRSIYDANSGHIYEDLEFVKCVFISSALSITRKPKLRSIVRNVKITLCEEKGCALEAAVIEDAVVDGLKTSDLFQCWGAVYKHVVLKGNIGRIMLSPIIATALAKLNEQTAFDKANSDYYEMVDWALDISEGIFYECEIQGIPSKLIRMDKETQIVISREKALEGTWKKLDLSKTHWATSIKFFLERGEPDVILVAPKRHPKYKDLLDGLKMLKDLGIADP